MSWTIRTRLAGGWSSGTFGLRQKEVKSCSPISGLTAACIRSRSSGCGTCQHTVASSGFGAGSFQMWYR